MRAWASIEARVQTMIENRTPRFSWRKLRVHGLLLKQGFRQGVCPRVFKNRPRDSYVESYGGAVSY